MFKKMISILLFLATILSFVGCSNNSIEEQIISNGKKSIEGFTPSQDTIFIDKNYSDYVISVNDVHRTYSIVLDEENSDEFVWTNIQEITSSNILKTINSSKELIINYINESLILKDKEELISYINNLPVKSANFPNYSLIAAFDEKLDTVFLNIQSSLLDKHTLVHELFHALSYKTRGSSNWNKYCTVLFEEAFTELLATSVIESNYPTAYDTYIQYVYHFIGCTGLEAIGAYFYGLDEMQIPAEEFHLYTIAIECLDKCKSIEEITSERLTLHLILSKWGLEK